MTTIKIYPQDRDWLIEIKNKKRLRNLEVTIERIIDLIKLKELEEEI